MGTFLMILQAVASIAMITMILIQTTKSEQSSGGGMGWGVIGGKSSSSIHRWGVEEHLGRITLYVAVAFLALSAMASVWRAHNP